MSLKDLQIPSEVVEVADGQNFTVRGLTFVDAKALLVKHSSEMARLFDLFTKGGVADADIANAAAMAGTLISEAPALAAEVISRASGDPSAFEIALTLPFTVQMDALGKIGRLTFASEEGAKKFLQAARSLIGVVKQSQKS